MGDLSTLSGAVRKGDNSLSVGGRAMWKCIQKRDRALKLF